MTLFEGAGPSVPGDAVRLKMTVAYDGSGFHGFAAQPGVPTVAGALAGAIEKATGHPVELTCGGRTDAGVHARGQVVHVDVAERVRGHALDLERLARSCNSILAPRIVVRDVSLAPDGFDARHQASSRVYRYSVLNAPVPDPLLAHLAWHVAAPLDIRAMQAATDPLLGEHDFAAFCRRARQGGSVVRRVIDARLLARPACDGCQDASLLVLQIEANAFCHQMVRSVAGALVEVGRGRLSAGELSWVLASAERAQRAAPAPPHGLCLWEIRYPAAVS